METINTSVNNAESIKECNTCKDAQKCQLQYGFVDLCPQILNEGIIDDSMWDSIEVPLSQDEQRALYIEALKECSENIDPQTFRGVHTCTCKCEFCNSYMIYGTGTPIPNGDIVCCDCADKYQVNRRN